ncbi:hypothetical protein GCM10010441_46790 [Kitasatospora paracochleata]|uniref:Molecular chaperone DnaJ n=1 Tax=Kitasatospora paracochleata TaxID=58354 RepID=A0ABT1J646_9ACTN|nr:hypothetical protein [Kitasatospora paracochleata]MCP2312905.1 hypothetical protein [Kitasatospora paracochleata]
MMPQHRHDHGRICPNCDGFARAAIATGNHLPDGSRHTIPVDCLTCHGLGVIARPLATAKSA